MPPFTVAYIWHTPVLEPKQSLNPKQDLTRTNNHAQQQQQPNKAPANLNEFPFRHAKRKYGDFTTSAQTTHGKRYSLPRVKGKAQAALPT